MPDLSVRRAAKFWVGLVGVTATALAGVIDSPILTGVVAVATAVGVYLVPNEAPAVEADEGGDL